MAPTKTPPNPPSSQNKKQQSISSFFTAKPSAAPRSSPPIPPARQSASLLVPQTDEGNDSQTRVLGGSKRRVDTNSDEENQEPDPKRSRPSPEVASSRPQTQTHTIGRQKDTTSHGNAQSSSTAAQHRDRTSARTSKYLFSSSPAPLAQEEPESAESIRQKELLHKRFVHRLGKPDSIAEIKRRYNNAADAHTENGDDEEGQEDDEPAARSTKGKKGGARANGKLTPMEVQFLEIKRKHMDTIIAYQVGYKYRFFGEDARVAAKELGMMCIPGKFRFDERELRIGSLVT
jgi:DNA mismatch repair protein MSH3